MRKARGWRWLQSPDRNLALDLSVGALQGAIEVLLAVSLASLIFAGPLEVLLPRGLGLALFAGAAHLIGSALLSSAGGIHSSVQDVPAVLLSVMVASVAAELGPQASLPTLLALLAISSLVTGLLFLLLGQLKLGGLVRYVPYPVIGGFLAATGWLLVQGAFGAITGLSLTLGNLPALLAGPALVQWLPAATVAAVLVLVSRRARSPVAIPLAIGAALIVFYLALAASRTSLEQAASIGLLFEGAGRSSWSPIGLELIGAADWGLVLAQAGDVAVLAGMSLLALLLGVSAIELAAGRELDLNRELKSAGLANMVSGLGGGLVGYHALSTTMLSSRLGVRSRLPGLLAGAVCLLAILAGTSLLAMLPKALVGGILLFLGLDFLIDWVLAGWSRFSRAEYAIVLLILGVIALTNFLTGVVTGLLTMVVMFVVSYSRTRVIRHAYTGADIHSMVVRSREQRRQVAEAGAQVEVLELQGFLFFGTANALLERVRLPLEAEGPAVRFVILDFRLVTGLDTSAALAFHKCEKFARQAGAVLVLTGASEQELRRLQIGGLDLRSEAIVVMPDLDRGMEWAEDRLVGGEPGAGGPDQADARHLLVRSGMAVADADRLIEQLEPLTVGAGEALIRKGDPATDVYFILTGRVSVWLEMDQGDLVRLRTLGPGTTVGEIGLYLDAARSADVVADEPTRALKLSGKAFAKMEREDPPLLAAVHQMIARQLAEWVVQGDRGLRALRR